LRIDINAQLLSVHVQTRYICHSDYCNLICATLVRLWINKKKYVNLQPP
jgi:hypothetical protein